MATDSITDRERALFELTDEEEAATTIDYEKPGASDYSGETTSTGGRSKHVSMDLAGSVFLIASNGRLLSLPIPSESAYDPLNWTRSRRVFIWTLLLLFSTISMFLIQTPGNLFQALLNDFDGEEMDPFTVDTLASCPTLLMGVGFFIWLPLCVAFGRRPVILLSSVTLFVATLKAGYADNFHQLLTAICFIGLAGGASISTCLLEIIDFTFIHERPLAITGFWSVGGGLALFALALLPEMTDTTKDWRTTFKATTIPAGVVMVLLFFFLPETYFRRPPVAFDGRILVQSGTEKVKLYEEWHEVPDNHNVSTTMRAIDNTLPRIEDMPVRTSWFLNPLAIWERTVCDPKSAVACLVQIFLCLGNPLMFWVMLLNAVNFSGMMSIGTGFPAIMPLPPYNLDTTAIARVNWTAGAGALLSLPLTYYMLNNITKRLTLRNKGVRHAEYYLPAFILPVVTGAASEFIYAFAAAYKLHYSLYHISYGLNAMSFASGSICNTVWVTESLPQWAAPGIAVAGGVSYIVSWGITAALPAWNDAWGVLAVNLAIGVMIAVVGLFAVPLAFWGKSVRQYINGRWGAYEGGALRPQSGRRES